MTMRAGDDSSKSRLLEAAAGLFAQKGFHRTRVQEICDEAGANIAAVNYHFGNKRRLYEEVLEYAFREISAHEPGRAADGAGAGPEEQLRLFVRELLTQLLSQGRKALYARILTREMADPTPAFDRIVESGIKPQVEELEAIARQLIGGAVPAKTVRRAAGSVLGQCLYYRFAASVIRKLDPDARLDLSDVEELSEHITGSALAMFDRLREA